LTPWLNNLANIGLLAFQPTGKKNSVFLNLVWRFLKNRQFFGDDTCIFLEIGK
jgi:hypothetical protein